MLARIWWKEGRTMAPIAAILAAVLVALQGFLLAYGGREIRHGGTVQIALGWAVLYALVAGAASFAGERELRMMGFLDALPVGRGLLWAGKVSFVLASSLLIGLAFWGVGLLGYDGVQRSGQMAMGEVVAFCAMLLVEAAVWGLVWSAIARSAIAAGVLAVITTTASVSFFAAQWQYTGERGTGPQSPSALAARFAVLGVALAASWVALRWDEIAGNLPRWRLARVAGPTPGAVAEPGRLHRPIGPGPAFWSVAWQTAREGRGVWLQATGLLLLMPLAELIHLVPDRNNAGLLLGLAFLAALIAGPSVFGLENSAGTRQFLDNQAVSPRTAWAAKVATWGLGGLIAVGLTLLASAGVAAVTQRWGPLPSTLLTPLAGGQLVAALANVLGCGLVAGMIFTRRITATLIGGLAALGVAAPQVGLAAAGIIPPWSLALTPLVLLAISFGWAGDWLAVRGNWRRWARLAVLAAVPAAVLAGWFVAGRAYGIPDIGPQFDAITQRKADGSLRAAYLQAAGSLPATWSFQFDQELAQVREQSWGTVRPGLLGTWQANRPAIEAARRLAASPDRVEVVANPLPGQAGELLAMVGDRSLHQGMQNLAALLMLDAIERRSRGDFAGAWEDILAQYRMSNQLAAAASTLVDYASAMLLARYAQYGALAWAREPALTREAARAARATLVDLPLPGMTEVIRAESGRLEAALDQPTARWVDIVVPPRPLARNGDDGDDSLRIFQRIGAAWLIAPAWERERTRRILRQVTRIAVRYSENGTYEHNGYAPFWPMNVPAGRPNAMDRNPSLPTVDGVAPRDEVFGYTPLADHVIDYLINAERAYDLELARRALLDAFLAARAWQIGHGGTAPETMAQVSAEEPGAIPEDPFGSPRRTLQYERALAVRDMKLVPDEAGPLYYLRSVGPDGLSFPRPLVLGDGSLSYQGTMQDDLVIVLPVSIPPAPAPAAAVP